MSLQITSSETLEPSPRQRHYRALIWQLITLLGAAIMAAVEIWFLIEIAAHESYRTTLYVVLVTLFGAATLVYIAVWLKKFARFISKGHEEA